jgi:hypothetical protein
MAKDEVDAEIKFASEQAADNSRWQQRIEFVESREHRIRHVNEINDQHGTPKSPCQRNRGK